MSTNPFALPTTYLAEQQQLRRERVKITVYTVLGCLVVLCLALLFQGCRTHSASAENPLAERTASGFAPSKPAPEMEKPAVSPSNPAPAPVVAPPTLAPAQPVPAPAPSPAPARLAPSKPVMVSAPAAEERVYVIKKGDSLSSIARLHGTTVQALKAANGLTSDRILAGKTLKLPSAS